jgi:hypothetical protein
MSALITFGVSPAGLFMTDCIHRVAGVTLLDHLAQQDAMRGNSAARSVRDRFGKRAGRILGPNWCATAFQILLYASPLLR